MDLFLYFLQLIGYWLGVAAICGLAVELLSRSFGFLIGRKAMLFFGVTSIVGTPVHELGHAIMCLLFTHQITGIKLWDPTAKDGTYGYVEHSYSRKNLWARIGNLPIGLGPLFSGLGVTVLVLWLCFPELWKDYLASSGELIRAGRFSFGELMKEIFSLFLGLPGAFRQHWVRSLIGTVILLSVSLHVSLSWKDIQNGLSALPIWLALIFLLALCTRYNAAGEKILRVSGLFAIRATSLFALVIAFATVWVLTALLLRTVRAIIRLF